MADQEGLYEKGGDWEMTKRSNKKLDLLDRHEKLTPEVKNRLEQRKKKLLKDLNFINKLLEKPVPGENKVMKRRELKQ